MVGDTELMICRGWLGAIALFEFPEIFALLSKGKPVTGFFSTLKREKGEGNGSEKRVWAMVLTFLVLSRVQAVAYTHSPGVMTHCAAVHTLEAVVFGYEYFKHKSKGNSVIYAIILANALWFSSVAYRLSRK